MNELLTVKQQATIDRVERTIMNSIQQQQQNGYADAQQFDSRLNHLLVENPIEDNPMYWLTLCRTIKSSLSIIESIIAEKKPMAFIKFGSKNRKQ